MVEKGVKAVKVKAVKADDNKKHSKHTIAIMVLALAVIILGVMLLTLLRDDKFKENVSDKIAQELESEPPMRNCTENETLTFSPMNIRNGKETKVTTCFFSKNYETISPDFLPRIKCGDIEGIEVKGIGHQIPYGFSFTYELLLTIPEVPKTEEGTNIPCTISIGQIENEPFVTVK